jgi:hypothetical protein
VETAGKDELFCTLSFHRLNAEHTALIDRAMGYFESGSRNTGATRAEAQTDSIYITSTPVNAMSAKYIPAVTTWTQALSSVVRGIRETLRISRRPREDFRSMRLGDILVAHGRMSKDRMEEECRRAEDEHMQLGRYLVKEKLISPVELRRALALQTGLPIVNLNSIEPTASVMRRFTKRMMTDFWFVPFNECGDTVYIACSQPLNADALGKLQSYSRCRLKLFLAYDDDVESFLKDFCSASSSFLLAV